MDPLTLDTTTLGVVKVFFAGIVAWLIASLTACGVTSGDFTMGSTSFLEEVNRTKIEGERHVKNYR